MATDSFIEDTASITPPGVIDGLIDSITDGVAVVMVGEDGEEWNFPTSLLPKQATVGTVLILGRHGARYEVLGLRLLSPSVESRLGRELFRRRPIAVPLPHRVVALDTSPVGRSSRMVRNLGR